MINNFRLLLFLLLLCNCVGNQKDIRNVISPFSQDWKTSFIGDTIKTQFSFFNKEKTSVTIDYIDTPCGCITAIPEQYIVERNDSTIIHVEFVPFELGYTEKNLFVYLEEGDPVHFVIKGKILKRSEIVD